MNLRTELRAVGDLIPYERNNKAHPKKQIETIKASIRRFGFNDPIGVTESGIIVEGHGRLQAATELGMAEVPVIVLPDTMTPDMIDLYRIAHNRLALTSTFDFHRLAEQMRDILQSGAAEFIDMGFDPASVASLFASVDQELPTSNGTASDVVGGTDGTAPEHNFDIIWQDRAVKDRFTAFVAQAVATYGGSTGDALAAMAGEAMTGKLMPQTVRPTGTENEGDLAW